MGTAFHIYERTGIECTVHGYSSDYKPKIIKVAHGGTAYDHPNGHTYILDFNNSLDMTSTLDPSLLNPNQLRHHGIHVDDIPTHLSNNRSSTHLIFVEDSNVTLHLELDGVISYLPIRKPTLKEIEDCTHLQMTSVLPWDPYSKHFAEDERLSHSADRHSCAVITTPDVLHDFDESATILGEVSTAFNMNTFVEEGSRSFRSVNSMTARTRKFALSAEILAKKWCIGIEAASRTLQATTQRSVRSAIDPLHRRFRTRQQQFRYNRLNTKFYSDTMFSRCVSLDGNSCAQIFVNDLGYSKVVPMKGKAMAYLALEELFNDVGVPTHLHTDGAKELTIGKWKDVREKHGGIRQSHVEPFSPWQNRAESEIREIKKSVRRMMQQTGAHHRLWDYCAVLVSEMRSRSSLGLYELKGRTPIEHVTGDTPDISEWTAFTLYQPVWQLSPTDFPESKRVLGRWLGVAHHVGQALCYWILTPSGQVIARSTVQEVTKTELSNSLVIDQLNQFDSRANMALDRGGHSITLDCLQPERNLQDHVDDYLPMEPEALQTEIGDYEADAYDKLISAQVTLPIGDRQETGRVTKRMKDEHGNPVGTSNANPLLDDRLYQVEFSDGNVKEYHANVLAEAIFSQVDSEGRDFVLFDDIIDHECDHSALDKDDGIKIKRGSGNPTPRKTTKGWKLLVQWKNGETTWLDLKDVKESHPVQVAEYAVGNKLESEPAFAWWVRHTLKRKERMIGKLNTKYWTKTHKFGVPIPKTVLEALKLDREAGNTLWQDAVLKEMKNTRSAFQILDDSEKVPIGYQFIKCHMIFDVKMDFTRKARFVAGGHMTTAPASMTYSSVVSRDSVRIAFMLAALNGIDVKSADVGNAYLNADCRERVYMRAGPEFGSDQGKHVLIVRALYGLKSSGAAWRAHLAQSMTDLNFKACLADPDVWLRPANKKNGTPYYQYVLIYVDDILVCAEDPDTIMTTLSQVYRLKEDPATGKKWDAPTRYLGANVGKYTLNGASKQHWYLSSDEYVANAVKNVETELKKIGQGLTNNISAPMAPAYHPELDVTPILGPDQLNYFQNLIGVLRWGVELGRVDINLSVSLLSQYLAQPREGHLEAAFKIFAYLKKYARSKLVFNDEFIHWRDKFTDVSWTDFYPDAAEPIPHNAPSPLGPEVQINCFVDADHAGNKVTRRSHTGVLIYLNSAPIIWYSKRQNTIETSTFGSEFIALKVATELIQGLRYKLRMMGVLIDGPANVFCDNQSVVTNSSVPESTLKKKHVSICYHRVREACASHMIRICSERTGTNLADCLTKPLTGTILRALISKILF